MENILSWDITKIKGVSDGRKKRYNAIGISTIGDLINHYPREYIDLSSPLPLKETDGENHAYFAKVTAKNAFSVKGGRMFIFTVKIVDQFGYSAEVKLFNTKYTYDGLIYGKSYFFYGKLVPDGDKLVLSSPQVFDDNSCGLMPIYSATTSLSSKLIETHIKSILPAVIPLIKETLPKEILEKYSLPKKEDAILSIHHPMSREELENAKRRLFFEEIFFTELSLGYVKRLRQKEKGAKMEKVSIDEFISSLPFELSDGQKNAIDDIISDMADKGYMNRLVEGDVGCGKTVVSAAALYFTAKNGYQGALMAPTEVLATQHYESVSQMLAPFGVKCVLLTGSLTPKEKREAYALLESGEAKICIGTHALISEKVKFKNLALVVTDEQHRFGVRQRTLLSEKGEGCYTLVMSATPIPRTLSLIMYGDLDISIIEELPKGRQEIDTLLITESKRERAFGFIKKNMDEGGKAYIVCPLIDESEKETVSLKSTEFYEKEILDGSFKGYKAAVLHGRLKADEKDKIISDFRTGDLQLLVSTTVIEVGIDAPDACVIFIEDADRFGLSQLHQLRGRVGRGTRKSYCILMTSTHSHEAAQRLKAFSKMKSGFDVATEDLKLRGAGEVLGSRQHGSAMISAPVPSCSAEVFKVCSEAVNNIMENRFALTLDEKKALKEEVSKELEGVGESLN